MAEDLIPISAAKAIGKRHAYDQVIILGRRVGVPGLAWVTTWGRDEQHCAAAAKIGDALRDEVTPTLTRLTARVAKLERILRGVQLVRPENWDDDEDPEQCEAWRAVADALAGAK